MERLFPTGTSVMDPKPSPDGTRVAFVVADYLDYIGDVYVAKRDGVESTQITLASELDDQPSWSPGGAHIAFRRYRTGRDGDIWVMGADGRISTARSPTAVTSYRW